MFGFHLTVAPDWFVKIRCKITTKMCNLPNKKVLKLTVSVFRNVLIFSDLLNHKLLKPLQKVLKGCFSTAFCSFDAVLCRKSSPIC